MFGNGKRDLITEKECSHSENISENLNSKEEAKFWFADDLGKLECLYGKYHTFSFAKHFHDAHAIGVIEKGTEEFDYRGNKYTATEGEIMLLNPSEIHTGNAVEEAVGWTFRIMYINPEMLRNIREEISGKRCDIPFFSETVVRDSTVSRRFIEMHRTLENSDSPLERESVFLLSMTQLITRYADDYSDHLSLGKEHEAVARAKDYITANFRENITLDELSQVAFLSQYHLLRVFRREIGLPPHAYQTQLRIEQAKQLLLEDFTIAQVALAVGFFDQAHFSKRFKRHVGITPGQFLSQNSKKIQDSNSKKDILLKAA